MNKDAKILTVNERAANADKRVKLAKYQQQVAQSQKQKRQEKDTNHHKFVIGGLVTKFMNRKKGRHPLATSNCDQNMLCEKKGELHMPCNISSINQIHKRLNEEGFAISKRLLRQMVDTGQLPYVKSGSKYLINYDSTVELLRSLTTVPVPT